jgi:hypothetical protein
MPDATASNIPSTVYGGQWDHLPLPGGGTIGKTADTQVLRRLFDRMKIEHLKAWSTSGGPLEVLGFEACENAFQCLDCFLFIQLL